MFLSLAGHAFRRCVQIRLQTLARTAALAVTTPPALFAQQKQNFSVDYQSTDPKERTAKLSQPQRTASSSSHTSDNDKTNMDNKGEKITVNKEELKKRLTPMQYQVTQEAATERPFTGCYNKHYEKGMYQCIVCHQDLFSSDTKYDSGCGWPAFNDVLDKGKVTLHRDASIPGGNILLLIKHPERIRTEVRCARCNAHMGHVFEDGPKPTRKRYCINSAAIEFVPADQLNSGTAAPAPLQTPIVQQ